ncbi:hypothetical protein [Planctomicrobium sp. SH527]|uniref:hypothetical protein n=1 Tax=Planctomicrobium sp. SH527 TaxID=3448123 RepID=UPI003F5B4EBD
MADPRLLRRLDQVSDRSRRWKRLAASAIGWTVLAVCLWSLTRLGAWQSADLLILPGVIAVILAGVWTGRRQKRDLHDAALLIEKNYPELDGRLITAVEQHPQGRQWDFTYLQSELLNEVFSHLRQKNWHETINRSQLRWIHAVHLLAFVAAAGMAWTIISHRTQGNPGDATGNNLTAPNPAAFKIDVEPGDVELERGTPLLVLARFTGSTPSQVELVTRDSNGGEARLPLNKSLNDPLFGGRVPQVQRNLTYHIEADGERTPDFQVTTFDYPDLVQADAVVNSPEYTGIAPKSIADVRRVTVVEGSQLDLTCLLNKPVKSARLQAENLPDVELTSSEKHPHTQMTSWSKMAPGEWKYKLILEDEQGRQNRLPPEIRVSVVENRAPDLKVAFPAKDLRVSSLQELLLSAEASDDYGLKELGLIYQLPTGQEETLKLNDTAKPDEKSTVSHLLAFESLAVKPDDLVSYYFYADDLGPDGIVRRTFSDLFFAEVRPFEEIFRQVPPSNSNAEGEQAEGGPSQQLLELQKQVVTGTWNVIRRERRDPPTTRFSGEVNTLAESQRVIQQQAEQLESTLEDPQLKQHAQQAIRSMKAAAESFQQTVTTNSIATLPRARDAAQQAYRALLQMQSRENQVSQSQSRSGKSSSQQMNQQMQSLQLKNDQDRYEQERQAQAEKSESDQSMQRVLNQLKELAQRQADLNDRLRELESALRKAESEEDKEAIQRELKRLQEEQRELLQELDEARERMNQEQSRSELNEARQQAEQTRQHLQQTADALQKGQTSQALTEGSRAQQQLEKLEEQVREKVSGRFDNAMKELRDDTRKLADRQEEISKLLEPTPNDPAVGPRSLRENKDADENQLAEQMTNQKEKLSEILERAKDLVVQSESSEPLLSKKLYDTLRNLQKYEPEKALEQAAMLSRRGLKGNAADFEKQASQGIDELKAGIEEAAESILGNEDSALRLAQQELSQLAESIRQELEQGAGSPESGQSQQDSQPEKMPAGNSQKDSTKPEGSERSSPMNEPSSVNSPQEGAQNGSEQSKGKPTEGMPNSPSGESPSSEKSQSPSQGGSQSPSQQQSPGNQSGGQSPGQQQQQQTQQSGQQAQQSQQAQQGQQAGGMNNAPSLADALNQALNPSGAGGPGNESGSVPNRPLSGGAFREWSDRMRDVEEMLTTPELRAQAAAIRDRARLERLEVKRHSKQPDKELVRTSIYGPLLDLQRQIDEELIRRNPDNSQVPIDRDLVPDRYQQMVKDYYEQLSRKPQE